MGSIQLHETVRGQEVPSPRRILEANANELVAPSVTVRSWIRRLVEPNAETDSAATTADSLKASPWERTFVILVSPLPTGLSIVSYDHVEVVQTTRDIGTLGRPRCR